MSVSNIKRRGLPILLITALVTTGLFSCRNVAYADRVILSEEIYYHLDMGVQIAYNPGCDWGSDNIYSSSMPLSVKTTITFNSDVEVLDTYPLDSAKGSRFDFCGETSSHNIPNALGEASWAYNEFYTNYVSTAMTEGACSSSGRRVSFDYTVKLITPEPLEVVEYGKYGNDQEIYRLFGGKNALEDDQPEIAEAVETALTAGREGTAGANKLYLIFCPNVIEYKKYITIGDLEADLKLPSSVKQGESYTAEDNSYVDSSLTVAEAVLEKHYGDGAWETVAVWEGPDVPGENTGGSIDEICEEICTITYRLTVSTVNGQTDSDIKTIKVTDSRDITVDADLVLPEYTYEGHTELALDQSVFEVDGTAWSAARAYAENLAANSFEADSSTIDIDKLTNTKAECRFSKQGTYRITLNVRPDGGSRVTDTESIEVRKTPYILDTLTGFQKQNRKQVLTAAVATYPGKPLTEYSITLKDKKTGESVTLSSSNPQQNTSAIKTRAVTMTQDVEKGFAYITVEFLTKTPSYFSTGANTQDFYYEINVTDSKGDTDRAAKTFEVSPDLPPTPEISLDSAFLRNEGTNVATIKAEDVTIAVDGDGIARTWCYGATALPAGYTDVSAMDGYQKLSFGTDKIVGFHAVGVGQFTTKLFVKEVWTEPTLEEYVTDADHLTGTATALSDIQNVAPIVSLELLNGTEKNILLIANNSSEYQTLLNKKTELQQELLANKIDGHIMIKKLIGDTPPSVTGLTEVRSYQFPTTVWQSGGETDRNPMVADSERLYFTTWTIVDNKKYTAPATVHAFDPYSGEVWSYTTTRDEQFSLGNDDLGKYLYLIYASSDQTVLLDKRTGTIAGTVNIALPEKLWLSDTLFFAVEDGNLYAINQHSLNKMLVDADVSAAARVGGKLVYVTRTANAVIRNTLTMDTLTITRDVIVSNQFGLSSSKDYMGVCIDATGKVVLFKFPGTGEDTFSGIRQYSVDNQLIREVSVSLASDEKIRNIYAPLDEEGRCNHVIVWKEDDDDVQRFTGVNLNTGSQNTYAKKTDLFNSMSFGGVFQSKGTSCLYGEGWYLNNMVDYHGPAAVIKFNGTSITHTYNATGMIDTCDEDYTASDRILAAVYGNNSTGRLDLKISAFPKTLAEEASEIIERFADKFTFVGGLNTTADQIKETMDAPKSMVEITANNNGSLSLNNVSLTAGKKYYYEYEIKPLTEGTREELTGITAATGTTTSPQSFLSETLYVTDSYEEDFNSGTVNRFFTVEDGGWFRRGGYGNYYNGSKDKNSSTKLSFVVPDGKQAIVSFDYDFRFNTSSWEGTNIFIDGLRMDESPKAASDDGENEVIRSGHKIFYKILNSGTHSIECKVSAKNGWWDYVLIDNLKVDILSTTPKTITPMVSITDGESKDWCNVTGTFDIQPGIISYGTQASTTYYGGLPVEIVGYDRDDRPDEFEYTQTVPAGYLQKGSVHYVVNYMRSHVDFILSGVGEIEKDSWDEGWISLCSPKTAGTYKHRVEYGSPHQSNFARLDVFDLVTYPDNIVTRTGNMAFNSANTKYFFPKVSSTGKTNLMMFLPKGEYLIKNLRVYYIENGQKVYLENKALEDVTQMPSWTLSSGLTASNISIREEETDDEYVKIYKKGEKVLYNIFYEDYEDDPSKIGYWVYSHVNWPPDGIHPEVGKVLTAPVDRFYLSGKYTVTHWQLDNTQRAGTLGDASSYNRESNKVELTFYIDGEEKAPWITYIKTNPSAVKENDSYTIGVGVDDTEKDTLRLETEVYLNGKRIRTDTKTGIQADSNGDYPEQTVSGLPDAVPGVYQVICTVSDHSGTGIKAYRFTVVSAGRVTGAVNHTEQWDINRKKYNLKRFSDEINRSMLLDDYIAMTIPRMRGTNVFWSGEKFMLNAETEGSPAGISVQIFSYDAQGNLKNTGYASDLTNTGRKTPTGAELWEGSLWDSGMINKWGRKSPEELLFRFTSFYPESLTKTHTVSVIMDSDRDYWQLHRLW